jgi:hypothetical protein
MGIPDVVVSLLPLPFERGGIKSDPGRLELTMKNRPEGRL